MHRFYIPSANWNPNALVLDEHESHHANDVLRLSVGDRVIVFNGEGVEASAEILRQEKRAVHLKTLALQKTLPPPAKITLCQAVPKGKNMDLIIEKAVELGASAIVPVLSDRTVVKLDADEAAKKQEKWQRVAIEACKQCGQNWLPIVSPPIAMEKYLPKMPKVDLRLIAAIEPDARRIKEILQSRPSLPRSVTLFIGPEGDFTPAELGSAKSSGCEAISLGPIILRTETAAIYTLSVLAHELF